LYTIFSFDVSLAVVGEAVLFVARATLERFKVAETGVSGRSSRFCRELLLQPFPPGTQPAGGPIKLPQLDIDH